MKIRYQLFLVIFIALLGCDPGTKDPATGLAVGDKCSYDTNCGEGLYCNRQTNLCTEMVFKDQICTQDQDCEGSCDEGTLYCGCNNGSCEPYNACDPNPCKDQFKTTCVQNDGAKTFQCLCSEGYEDNNGECSFICNQFGIPNESNDGCDCINGYSYDSETGECLIDCSEEPFTEPNGTNTDCICIDGYSLVSSDCIIICEDPNSHPSEENDSCDCDNGYIESAGLCCPQNSTHQLNGGEPTGVCKCNDGYHQEGEVCIENTPCSPNPCTDDNHVNQTICEILDDSGDPANYQEGINFQCNCDEGYHNDQDLCCPLFHSNVNGVCISDYTYCSTDNDCPGGEVCKVNMIEYENTKNIVSYCEAPNFNGIETAVICETDDDCYSGICYKEGEDQYGYCTHLCSQSILSNPCINISCETEDGGTTGSCIENETYNLPKCSCPVGFVSQGDKCVNLYAGRGNVCGVGEELLIETSGFYYGDTNGAEYTNNHTPGASPPGCSGFTTNPPTGKEIVFKMVLTSKKEVTLEIIADNSVGYNIDDQIEDTILYVKDSCEGDTIACNDDVISGIRRSKLTERFSAGVYYVFVDSLRMDEDDWGEFVLKVDMKDLSCPVGTTCVEKDFTIDTESEVFNMCEPIADGDGFRTICYNDNECEEGRVCQFTTTPAVYLACVLDQENYVGGYEIPGTGEYCASGLYSTATNECRSYCRDTLDCRVGYNCETFSVNLSGGGTYSSVDDDYRMCFLKNGVELCSADSDCETDNYCMPEDNGDDRLYTSCKPKRTGFDDSNIGANCSSSAFRNCYNYLCYHPSLEDNNSDLTATPYCTQSCINDSNCPDLYECLDSTFLYKELTSTSAICKPEDQEGCVKDVIKSCVLTREDCSSNQDCSNGDICKVELTHDNSSHFYYCEEPEGGLVDGAECSNNNECQSGYCHILDIGRSPFPRICATPCVGEGTICGVGDYSHYTCNNIDIFYRSKVSSQNVCIPICDSDSDCPSEQICRFGSTVTGDSIIKTCTAPVGSKNLGAACLTNDECKNGYCHQGICIAPCEGSSCSGEGGFNYTCEQTDIDASTVASGASVENHQTCGITQE